LTLVIAAALPLPGSAYVSNRSTADASRRSGGFMHSVLSFTRLDIPQLDLFETAVTFPADTDPVTAHARLAATFGSKAGEGQFLFRLDSAVPGRFWVRSLEPWQSWPEGATSALEPKREMVQLAEGLMYRFTLPVCAGQEYIEGGEKRVVPFESASLVHAWFTANAEAFGFKPLMADIALATMRFTHRGANYKLVHAVIEGALEVTQANALRRRLVKGFGSHRKAGLGMLQLTH
jgi:hypothetical protein